MQGTQVCQPRAGEVLSVAAGMRVFAVDAKDSGSVKRTFSCGERDQFVSRHRWVGSLRGK